MIEVISRCVKVGSTMASRSTMKTSGGEAKDHR